MYRYANPHPADTVGYDDRFASAKFIEATRAALVPFMLPDVCGIVVRLLYWSVADGRSFADRDRECRDASLSISNVLLVEALEGACIIHDYELAAYFMQYLLEAEWDTDYGSGVPDGGPSRGYELIDELDLALVFEHIPPGHESMVYDVTDCFRRRKNDATEVFEIVCRRGLASYATILMPECTYAQLFHGAMVAHQYGRKRVLDAFHTYYEAGKQD